jgi:lipopolysaccharide/colanic/teichoic acid biosynthesis glycosyltransferase
MELATTLKTIETLPKRYRLFSIDAQPARLKSAAVRLEFFYIGKNHQEIDRLLQYFEGGYIAESVENTRIILQRMLAQQQAIPAFVLIDASLGQTAIKSIAALLQMNAELAKTPLIVNVSGETTAVDARSWQQFMVDDIVRWEDINHRFANRVRLLRRTKVASQTQVLEKKLMRSINEVDASIPFGKRVFDILVSGTLLFLLAPLFVLIAIAIKLESRGAVFYISKRAGRGYQVFNFFKFRSMAAGADKQVAQLAHLNQYDADQGKPVFFKLNNDPRVTKVGAFLRNTSLDELPQLLNVFLGDMSLVGNRPLPLYEAAALTTDEWACRFLAPAGITGLWQIKKRGQAEMSVDERVQLDIDYAAKHGFLFDLFIVLKTPAALFQKSNV